MNSMSEYAAIMARAQDLPLPAELAPGVTGHLEVAFRLARLVLDFELDDEAEPAPVFRP